MTNVMVISRGDHWDSVEPAAKESKPVKKVLIIFSKGKLEDVYTALIMANGALMEGI